MSWDQLRGLADEGWEIGSHTHSHPRLPALSDDDLHRELTVSRDLCAQRLDRPCTSLAYPLATTTSASSAPPERPGTRRRTLPGRLHPPAPLRWPRVGVYHLDTGRASQPRARGGPADHGGDGVMGKLRVMMLIDSLATGGAEDFAGSSRSTSTRSGSRPPFCVSRWSQERAEVPGCGGARAARGARGGGDDPRAPARPGADLPWRKRLSFMAWRPLLDRLAPDVDVLHAHKFGSNLRVPRSGRWHGSPSWSLTSRPGHTRANRRRNSSTAS